MTWMILGTSSRRASLCSTASIQRRCSLSITPSICSQNARASSSSSSEAWTNGRACNQAKRGAKRAVGNGQTGVPIKALAIRAEPAEVLSRRLIVDVKRDLGGVMEHQRRPKIFGAPTCRVEVGFKQLEVIDRLVSHQPIIRLQTR